MVTAIFGPELTKNHWLYAGECTISPTENEKYRVKLFGSNLKTENVSDMEFSEARNF